MRGTLLNTATVTAGSLIGLALGNHIPAHYKPAILGGLGLVTCLLSARMFFQSKNVLVVVGAIAIGSIIGLMLGLQEGLDSFALWAKNTVGGEGRFVEAVITPTLVFCVGPMTLLGCLQDALEKKIELLALKSTLDGIGAIFFAATLGVGVLVSAFILLVFQGLITLLAKPLQILAQDEAAMAEATAVGGAMLLGTGLLLLDIKRLPVAAFLPALVIAPVLSRFIARWEKKPL